MSHHHHHRWTLGKMQNPVRGFLHGTAAMIALAGTVWLLSKAPTWPARLAFLVFGMALVSLYTTSSLYHSIPWSPAWKARMQRLDHSMIFVLIAGTYTPIAFFALDGFWRWATLITIWGIAIVGIGQHAFFPREHQTFSIALLTTMGWLSLFVIWPFAQNAGVMAVVLMSIGGVLYTVGMVFMVTGWPKLWPRVFSSHELFHVLVIAGSAVHFAVQFRYIVPLSG